MVDLHSKSFVIIKLIKRKSGSEAFLTDRVIQFASKFLILTLFNFKINWIIELIKNPAGLIESTDILIY